MDQRLLSDKLRPVLYVAGALLLGYLWLSWSHDPRVAREAIQGVADTADDHTIARLKTESVQREAVFRHQQDSTGRVIRLLRSRVVPRDSIVIHDTVQVAAQLDARDSVIVALGARHAQDSLQILFWRGQVIAYRDSLVPRLTAARDNWKKAARPSVWVKVGRGLPWVAAGFVAAEILRR